MAGRGTDIVLGGNLEAELAALDEQATQAQKDKIRGAWLDRHNAVVASGGLHVIGSERHESRRIDNQLRGRSGRQGDPGSSRFFLSLEDDLMRIFASERVSGLMQKLGMGNGEAIEHPWVTRSIENAQRKVEAHNFNIRKEILAYDDVANDQRKVIYAQRSEIMAATDISEIVTAIREDVVNNMISLYIPQKTMMEQWNIEGLEEHLSIEFGVEIPVSQMLKAEKNLNEDTLRERIISILEENHLKKEEAIGADTLRNVEKTFMLRALDHNWKEHLAAMDYLRQGIHFRGYAQKDPKQEYKREAFEMFTNLLETIKFEVVGLLFKIPSDITAIQDDIDVDAPAPAKRVVSDHENLDDHFVALANSEEPTVADQPTSIVNSVGRNEPCPCGSGLRYKQCHGKLD
jgi:preprotein translocase subunit SecA